MAERPYVTGAIAAGIVAAALHIGTASAPSPAPQSSPASSAGTHGRHMTPAKSDFDRFAWSTEMKAHPEELGKLTAEKELGETIDEFDRSYAAAKARIPKSKGSQPACDANELEVMVAFVPDPVHTHLSLLFDREMDALIDSLQEFGWEYQANWLPWSSSSTAAGDHFVEQQQQHLFLEGREQSPGVILFRPKPVSAQVSPCDAGSRPLAVFLAGDSPTGGIDQTQLESALSRIQHLRPHETELRILGPTFTGSGPSLRAMLQSKAISAFKKATKIKTFKIASGTVTDPRCENLLPQVKLPVPAGPNAAESQGTQKPPPAGPQKAALAGAQQPAPPTDCHSTAPSGTTMVSFGVDKEWRDDQIDSFLWRTGEFQPEQIAHLSEDESSYGGDYRRPSLDIASSNEHLSDEHLHLFFPRNISHLRSAYQKSNIFGFGASESGSGNISLNLDFDESNGDDDTIPNFAGQQMPVSQDGVMRQIADVIEQRHIRVVTLSATDVLDELFVAELLARQAPNALVVINQSDNLFLRSSSANNFGNMYFTSPWPLMPDSQLWTSPPGPHQYNQYHYRIFPSDLSQGVYTAVEYLYQTPEHPIKPPDYNSPLNQTGRPPLWLSAVGHGEFWPVALLEPGPAQSSFHLPKIEEREGHPSKIFAVERSPLSQNLLILLACMFALYHVAKCLDIRFLQGLSYRYTINDSAVRTPKLCLQLGMTALLLLAIQLILSPSAQSGGAKMTFYWTCAALCFAAASLLYRMKVREPSFAPGVVGALLISISTLVFLFFVCYFWQCGWDWLSGSSGFPDFFRYRASYPLRGVSPVFPLFLGVAALFVLMYNHLDRIAFTENLEPRLPDAVADPANGSAGTDLSNCPSDADLEPVSRLLRWPPYCREYVAPESVPALLRWLHRWEIVLKKTGMLAGVTLVVWVCLKPFHLRPRMFDGHPIERLMGGTMLLLVVAILWELLMAGILWQRLKSSCLDQLESSPLRRGFSTIHGLTWSSLWIIRGNLAARYRIISRLLEQVSREKFHAQFCDPEGGDSLKTACEELSKELKERPPDLERAAVEFGKVQRRIANIAYALLKKLHHNWTVEECLITAPDAPVEKEASEGCCVPEVAQRPEEKLRDLREEWVALVYIHYVRMVLLQIRSRLLTAGTIYIMLVWASTSYPYLNRHAMLVALSALLGVLSFAAIMIYASINRDAILSRATNHTPGHLDLDFYLKTASLVGIPLLGFVASQFPEVSSFLFSWIEPGMTAVK